jgi:hypothetical protein
MSNTSAGATSAAAIADTVSNFIAAAAKTATGAAPPAAPPAATTAAPPGTAAAATTTPGTAAAAIIAPPSAASTGTAAAAPSAAAPSATATTTAASTAVTDIIAAAAKNAASRKQAVVAATGPSAATTAAPSAATTAAPSAAAPSAAIIAPPGATGTAAASTAATTGAPSAAPPFVPPPVPPPVAQRLNVFTVIDGVEYRGQLELKPPTLAQQARQRISSLTRGQTNIESDINLIPDSPTLDGPIKILLAVHFIQEPLKLITLDTFNKNYTQYYQYVTYTSKILEKVNKMLNVIRASNNNRDAYLKKYNEAFTNLKNLCINIVSFKTAAINIALTKKGTTHPTQAAIPTVNQPAMPTVKQDANILRTDDFMPYDISELQTMLDFIKVFIAELTELTSRSKQAGGNAKTRRKRLRRRRSKKHL